MTVYITKTWGFGDPCGPLQFSLKGWRDRAREDLKPGDLVVIVGTKGKETVPEDRGKILGLMEPTTIVISSLDYNLARGPQDFDSDGRYRWPFGLELHNDDGLRRLILYGAIIAPIKVVLVDGLCSRQPIRSNRQFYGLEYCRFPGVVVAEENGRSLKMDVGELYAAKIFYVNADNSHPIPQRCLVSID